MMTISCFFQRCKCNCGCGHECKRRYGPYFFETDGKKSKYLGKFAAAIKKLNVNDREARKALRDGMVEQALSRALSLRIKGFDVLPPELRGPHIAELHGRLPRPAKEKMDRTQKRFYRQLMKQVNREKGDRV